MKKNAGITLIALVVTIVVLLILAAVSISMLTGENGIITEATEAKNNTEIGEEKEIVKLAVADAKTKSYDKNNGIITNEMLQESLDIITVINKTTVEGTDLFIVKFNDTKREYYVDNNGNIIIQNSNIFTYTSDGYITGIKDEYIYYEDEREGSAKKYASLEQIKISAVETPRFRMLEESIGTIIYIPRSINNIDIIGISANAFYAIKNLHGVIMQDNIITIGDNAFYFCKELYNVKLSKELKTIGDNAFRYCFTLPDIIIGNKIAKIGKYCFNNTSIEDNVYIPDNVVEIGEYAFSSVAFARGTINCEATEKPEKWEENWNCIFMGNGEIIEANVNWGCKK